MKRSDLRALAVERAENRCEFPDCDLIGPLEMAHLKGSGAGGSKYRDVPENVAMLCQFHHGWLDGVMTPNMRRFENEMVFRKAINRPWPDRR